MRRLLYRVFGLQHMVESHYRQAVIPQLGNSTQGANTRLNYARNYLRKLIQIEVPVPVFERLHVIQMLNEEQQRELFLERWWERCERALVGGVSLARIAFGIAVASWAAWQAAMWLDIKERAFASEKASMVETARGAEEGLDAARRFVNFLKSDVEVQRKAQFSANASGSSLDRAGAQSASVAGPTASAASASSAASTLAATIINPLLALAEREAKLKSAELLLARADAAVMRLEEQVRQRKDKAAKESVKDIENLRMRLASLEKADILYQAMLDIERSQTAQVAVQMAPAASAFFQPDRPRAEMFAASADVERPQWPLTLSIVLLFLGLGIGLPLVRDRYLIRERYDYRQAASVWAPVLLSVDALRAPRELKRFLNLSRYLAVRLNPESYVSVPKLKQWLRQWGFKGQVVEAREALTVAESCIVALTALYLVRPAAFRNSKTQIFLQDPLAALEKDPESDKNGYLREAIRQALTSGGGIPPWRNWKDVQTFLASVGEIEVEPSESHATSERSTP